MQNYTHGVATNQHRSVCGSRADSQQDTCMWSHRTCWYRRHHDTRRQSQHTHSRLHIVNNNNIFTDSIERSFSARFD